MSSQEVDLVAGDLTVVHDGTVSKTTSVLLMNLYMDSILPTALALQPRWGLGSIPDKWADVCGFLNPPGSQRFWKVNGHDTFSIPRKSIGLRTTDQSCHRETWPHSFFVDWSKYGPGKMRTSHAFHYKEDPRMDLVEIPNDVLARFWATTRSRHNCETICMWCSLFCETRVTILSRRKVSTFRSIGTTRTPSPSDVMTRLSQRGRCFPHLSSSFLTRSQFVVLVSSHITLHTCIPCEKTLWRQACSTHTCSPAP